jgi:hypothetical protein
MKMLKLSILLLLSVSVIGCTGASDKKYELKSPCVSADIPGATHQAPCVRRRPINQDVS